VAWGNNGAGALGDGNTINSDVPVAVSGPSGVSQVSAGLDFSLGLLGNGSVVAWGENGSGQLGDGSEADSYVPTPVTGLSGVTEVSAGGYYSLALLSNGSVTAWGTDTDGELGDGKTGVSSNVPVAVSGLSGVTAIAAGRTHALALLGNGTVMAWGFNLEGELGNGTTTESDVPVAVSGLSKVTAIAAGEFYSLALLKNGTVMAWGYNESGELGDGTTTGPEKCGNWPCSKVPIPVSGLSGVAAISAGQDHGLALLSGGTVMGWGANGFGQLGDGTRTSSDVPVAVSGLTGVTAISAGYGFSLALLNNETVRGWGADEEGQLGDGKTEYPGSDVPVTVSELSHATAISAGGSHSLAFGVLPPTPTVTKIEPTTGAPAGGTSVTIIGTNFTGASAVKFGSTSAASFRVNSETSITATSPAGAGTVDVTVRTSEGTSPTSPADQFDYAPTVTNVEPDYGPPAGGTSVTIKGTDFNEVTAVRFGSTKAASFTVNSETSITAASPAGTGSVDVTVETAGGTSPTSLPDLFIPDSFNYAPDVTSVQPGRGPAVGGTTVTLTGTNFTGATAVTFGDVGAATSFKVESDTKITAVSPAFTSGSASVPVTVTTPGGTSSTNSNSTILGEFYFRYAPTVTRVAPNKGSTGGGTSVTIEGSGFTSVGGSDEFGPFVEAVRFGSTEATSVKVESENKITAVAPPGTGTVDVTVETLGGINPVAAGDEFSYGGPVIESESATGITEHDATLEAAINPEGLETEYEIWLVYHTCQGPGLQCQEISEERLGHGQLAAGDEAQTVSADLTRLQPGYSYNYWVVATNSGGKIESPHETFKALSPPPAIESESVSNITATDATLEAQITLGAHGAYYQFQVVSESGEYRSEIACPLRDELKATDGCQGPEVKGATIGYIPPGSSAQSVSLDLATAGMTLQPGTTYHYRVLAATKIQTEDTLQWETPPTYGPDQTFTTTSSRARPLGGEGEPPGQSSPSSPGGSSTGSNSPQSSSPSHALKPKALTRAQKLAKALKRCQKEPKHKRAECKKQAHKKYAPAKRSSKKR